MALIKCIECEKEFSDKAKACPNCGCPIEYMEDQNCKKNKIDKTKKIFRCANCNNIFFKDSDNCPYCGVDFVSTKVVDCSKEDLNLAEDEVESFNSDISKRQNNSYLTRYERENGKSYSLAITSLIFTLLVSRIIGLIMGIIVLDNNEGQQNKAKTLATISVALSITFLSIVLLIFVFGKLEA